MAAKKWFRVSVNEGTCTGLAYFYETDGGLYDLQYGWGEYTSRMHESLAAAMHDFRNHLQTKHDAERDAVKVSLGEPVEVSYDEVQKASPSARAVDAPE